MTKEPLQAAYRITQQYNPPLFQGSHKRPPLPQGASSSGIGTSIVVVEQVFRRDPRKNVIRWRRLHGGLFKYCIAKSSGYAGETLNLSMTAKQPPSYDAKVSWFRYEELVDDWVTITTVEAPKRGPLRKSRLTGDAYMYKAVLQNDLLQDPDEGVNYFKNTLKKYFLKGETNVYLYRLLSF